MIQLNEGDRSLDFRSGRADSPPSVQPAAPAQTPQEQESDEAVLFVSPPPLPWPRIFPPL
jgi:hypothetical protein